MNILVIGGTGTVGSLVVQGLLSRGGNVRVLTRSPEKSKALPKGAQGVVGDLKDPSSLPQAMQGIERVFLITPLSPTEAEEGINAVTAAKAAGVRHLVYLSVHDVEKAPHVPHFKSKIDVHKAIRESGMTYTLIKPNNFFQNENWFKQGLLEHGVYAQPIGDIGLSRVDARDIADAVVNALTQPGHEDKSYPLVGRDSLTGDDVAKIFSRHLKQDIRYGGNDVEAWGKQAVQMLPEWLVHDFKIMYEFFQKHGLKASKEDFAQQEKILGHAPRSFDAYVAETVLAWSKEMA